MRRTRSAVVASVVLLSFTVQACEGKEPPVKEEKKDDKKADAKSPRPGRDRGSPAAGGE